MLSVMTEEFEAHPAQKKADNEHNQSTGEKQEVIQARWCVHSLAESMYAQIRPQKVDLLFLRHLSIRFFSPTSKFLFKELCP